MNNQNLLMNDIVKLCGEWETNNAMAKAAKGGHVEIVKLCKEWGCLLYTSPSPRDATLSRMPSSA